MQRAQAAEQKAARRKAKRVASSSPTPGMLARMLRNTYLTKKPLNSCNDICLPQYLPGYLVCMCEALEVPFGESGSASKYYTVSARKVCVRVCRGVTSSVIVTE